MKPSLSQVTFLKDASPEALAEAQEQAAWFSLPAGYPLILEDDPADGVYFLISGTLAAFRGSKERGDLQLLGYIRPGEPVGEMALVAGEPHSAHVYGMRDCELLRLSLPAFEALVEAHPVLMMRMARLILARARMTPKSRPRAEPKIFALFSTSPTIDLRLRAKALKRALDQLGVRSSVVGEEGADNVSAWFDALERDNDVVLLVSPIADTVWFRACLRQADRIILLARADALPSVPLFPDDGHSPVQRFRLVDVALLHHNMERKAGETEVWRRAANATRIFHWRGVDGDDCSRIARVIAGRSLGLTLSGGGARAYAHIGVIRALREAGVPFDIVGGTSMGAIIAACYAMGWDDEETEVRIRKAFVESDPLGDYHLPVVSLTRGKRVEDRLQEHFGETRIEDLHVPFFCCSTDVYSGKVRVHQSGLLRHALRASISLPGILPPVVSDGGLLVDGAVLNNFPVDVMRALHRGPIVGVDVARRSAINIDDFRDPPGFFSWVAAHGLGAAPPIAALLMHTATLAVDPWAGRAHADLLITPAMPDVELRDWKEFDDAVAAGYASAANALTHRPDLIPGAGDEAALPTAAE